MNNFEAIENVPESLGYLKSVLSEFQNEVVVLEEGMGLFPNPEFGTDYYSIFLRRPPSKQGLDLVSGNIPDSYLRILRFYNGLKFFSLKLYGTYSHQERSDGHDLVTANTYWVGEYVGFDDGVMIGGGIASFDESFGLFMYRNGSLKLFLKGQKKPSGIWESLDSFFHEKHNELAKTEYDIHEELKKVRGISAKGE
ncbi:hypothetical protein [Cerasicoccus frondis]|uniref:hypothetical protein n=1 Tax=Cerasicoccus frondis TaxID=490090 RepID=UPI0028524A66|nr:hypothetical protein [Cerasicoccus frondis]